MEKIYKELAGKWRSEAEKAGVSVKAGVEKVGRTRKRKGEGRPSRYLVFPAKRGDVEAKVKFGESYVIRGRIKIWSDPLPGSGVDASVWGEYSREVDKAILAAVLKAVGIEKKIGDEKVQLTSGDLEKLRRFKSVDGAARKWLGEE